MPFKRPGSKTASKGRLSGFSWQRAAEIVMTGATAMAMLGPQKSKPFFRRFVTLMGLAGTIVDLCRRRS